MASKSYTFTLVLSGVTQLSRQIEDSLYKAGCNDALVGIRNGVVFLDFDRESKSFSNAVFSAIRDVIKAKIGVSIIRIEPDSLVNQAEIARRISQSRESVRKYIAGSRGVGNFPLPAASIKGTSPLWRWNEVASWFAKSNIIDSTEAEDAELIPLVNSILQLSHNQAKVASLVSKKELPSFTFLEYGLLDKPRKTKSRLQTAKR